MLKKYNKNQEISYAFGVSPAIELLNQKPESVASVLIHPKGKDNAGLIKIIEICNKLGISIEYNQKLIEKLSSSENTYCIGIFNKYVTKLDHDENHIVLVNPSDMGNLGTICRTMVAFNHTNLTLIKPAVDFFDPKVIRASMGAIFHLNIEYFDSFEDYVSKFKHHIFPFMCDGNNTLEKVAFKNPYSLVFGNEGEGLPQSYKNIGESVKIPQSDETDSLNLAIAVGIALYKSVTS